MFSDSLSEESGNRHDRPLEEVGAENDFLSNFFRRFFLFLKLEGELNPFR